MIFLNISTTAKNYLLFKNVEKIKNDIVIREISTDVVPCSVHITPLMTAL